MDGASKLVVLSLRTPRGDMAALPSVVRRCYFVHPKTAMRGGAALASRCLVVVDLSILYG